MKSEEAREEIILIVDAPIAGKAEALSQPKHRFETSSGPACRFEGLKASDLWHVLPHSKVVAFDALLEMFGNVVNWAGMRQAVVDDRLDRCGEGIGIARTDLAWQKQGFVLEHLAEEPTYCLEQGIGV